jgi:hypothetical protein
MLGWIDWLAKQRPSFPGGRLLGPAPSTPGPVAVMLRLQPGRDKTDGMVPVVFRLPGPAAGIDPLGLQVPALVVPVPVSTGPRWSELTQGRVSVSRLRGPAVR